jgi:hypothetical protein
MAELLRPFVNISKTIDRYKTFVFGEEESPDPNFLLAPGKVEELVREGRTPAKFGTIQTNNEPERPFYLVPPKGFDPKDIKDTYWEMGTLFFRNKLGIVRAALDYVLTYEQSQEVEDRVKSEKARLGKTN